MAPMGRNARAALDPSRRSAVAAASVAVLAILLTALVVRFDNDRYAREVRVGVARTTSAVATSLEQALSAHAAVASSLGAWASDHPDVDDEEFQRLATRLLPVRRGVRALELAPDGIIRYVHPVVGNEAALGLDLNEHPTGRQAMAQLREGTPILIEGPLRLVQGGWGVIIRTRVETQSPRDPLAPSDFWGVAIDVVDLDTMLTEAGLPPDGQGRLLWSLEPGAGTVGPGVQVGVDVAALDPIRDTIQVPGGTWQLATAPPDGWPSSSPQAPLLWGAGLVVAFAMAALAWRLRSEPARLRALVAEATTDAVHSQARTRAIMNTAGDAIISVDPEGVMTSWNPAACRMLRADEDQLEGRHLRSFLPINEIELEEAEGGHRMGRAEMLVERSDGSVFPAQVSVAVSQDRAIRTVIVRDITEERRKHEDLQRYAAELERLNNEQSAIDRLKRDFMAMSSHEIRTPITAIRGFALTLSRHWDDLAEEDRRRSLDVIHRQSTRLWQLVSDVLTTSQLEGGSIRQRVEPVEVQSAIEQAIRDAQVPTNTVSVECPDGLTTHVDSDHVTRILVSLLSNAVKYGRPPIRVTVSVDGDDVVVRVTDNGPGVPFEFRGRLFEPFSQASTGERREARGPGLGLSVARGLARASGGDVWHEDHPGVGATFALRFPRQPATPPPPPGGLGPTIASTDGHLRTTV